MFLSRFPDYCFIFSSHAVNCAFVRAKNNSLSSKGIRLIHTLDLVMEKIPLRLQLHCEICCTGLKGHKCKCRLPPLVRDWFIFIKSSCASFDIRISITRDLVQHGTHILVKYSIAATFIISTKFRWWHLS